MVKALEKLAALADPSRQHIFELLVNHPQSVGDLARHMTITRPAVSQHLKVLANAGLVKHESIGTRNIYRVNARALENLRDHFDSLWERALASFKSEAERLYQEKKHQ